MCAKRTEITSARRDAGRVREARTVHNEPEGGQHRELETDVPENVWIEQRHKGRHGCQGVNANLAAAKLQRQQADHAHQGRAKDRRIRADEERIQDDPDGRRQCSQAGPQQPIENKCKNSSDDRHVEA